MTAQTYIHRFILGSDPHSDPLLLLHRTGGGEDDLIATARVVSPGASLLALRGNVLEDGKARFFRRVGKGNFDLEDLAVRTRELGTFIEWSCANYKIARPIAFGFSNGANIAMSLVLMQPEKLRAAILLRPMWAYEPAEPPPLGGFPILVIAGRDDTTVPPELARKVPAFLEKADADVTFEWASGAHDLTVDDENLSRGWLKAFPADQSD